MKPLKGCLIILGVILMSFFGISFLILGVAEGDSFAIIFSLALIASSVYIVLKNFAVNQLHAKLKKGDDHYLIEAYNLFRFEKYYSARVQRLSFQALETIYILDQSHNIKTVLSRLQNLRKFLLNLYLFKIINPNRFNGDVSVGLEKYNMAHYDREIPKEAGDKLFSVEFLLETFDQIELDILKNAFKRFYEYQLFEISNLKQARAIKNRYLKILETAETLLDKIKFNSNLTEDRKQVDVSIFQEVVAEIESKLAGL